ncbi:MAG: phospholipid carrier-dependent glycosyltransferase [Deltaproteobacteria bacterium]|nr:phospholipid carrier-dependent glycosyltransferase [Deltaproteobacteria bacterium]
MTVVPQDRFSRLFYRTCLVGCFLGIVATLYFIAGVSGHLGSPLLNLVTAIAILLAALFFLYVIIIQIRGEGRLGSLIWILILGILLAEVLLGLVPPWARDELTHHLATAKLYVLSGRIHEIPFAPYSYYPMLLDMLYIPFVKWGWDSIPKLIHGLFGFLTGVLIYAYLARRLSAIYGLLGFLFFVFTPAILRLSNWAYVDLGLVFYSLASLLCLLWWYDTQQPRWLILAGLSVGFALSTKPNGLLVFFLLCFAVVFLLGKIYQKNIYKVCGWTLLFLFFASITFSPWWIKNLIQTGNAFYPAFAGFFSSVGEGSSGGGAGVGIFGKRALLWGESWWEIAALPIRVFFTGRDDAAQHFDGVLNPMLILFLPWAFKGKWGEEKKLMFGFVVFYFLYALFLVDLRIRYLLPMVAPLVILLVYGVHNIYLRILHPSILVGGVVILLAFNGVYLWNYFQSVSPLGFLSGKESREGFLTRMLPDYPAMQYINQKLPSTAKIYFIFMGRRVYYSERAFFTDPNDNPSFLLKVIQTAKNEDEIKVEFQQKGITHLLLRHDLFLRFLNDNLMPSQIEEWNRFGERYVFPLFRQGRYGVYELHRRGSLIQR